MKFANPGILAGSLLAAAAVAPAQTYDITVRTEDPLNTARVYVEPFPQEAPQSTPRPVPMQRVPVNAFGRGANSLGMYVTQVPPALSAQLKLKQRAGLVVEGVVPGSPAERAGVQQYDVISRVDDQDVSNPQQVERALGRHKNGDELRLDVIREGKQITLNVAVQRQRQSLEDDSNYRPVPKDKQKQVDEMSDRLKSELEKQEKRILELTEKIRAEAELARKQIQELKEQIRRDAQQQKEQMQKESKNRDDQSEDGTRKPEKF